MIADPLEPRTPFSLYSLNHARIYWVVGGTENANRTCLDPQRGHFNRLSNLASGKSQPLVQAMVTDQPEGEADQDRCQDRHARPVRHVPVG